MKTRTIPTVPRDNDPTMEPFRVTLKQKPFTREPTKHLIYHIYPVKDTGVWQWNVGRLLERIEMFDGVRAVSIATDDDTDSPEDVAKAFAGHRIDYFYVADNVPELRETNCLVPLLKLLPDDEDSITWVGHAKGVSHGPEEGPVAAIWTECMMQALFDRPELVIEAMKTHPVCGSFKRHGDFAISRNSAWHFSGSFYAFRNHRLFERENWDKPDMQWFGFESYVGLMFADHEAKCLVCDAPPDLHKFATWIKLSDELADFGIPLDLVPLGHKIELGGGHIPVERGFINLDRHPRPGTTDIGIDFETDQLPFANDTVSHVRSSHCLEHIRDLPRIMNEILRVSMVRAVIEIAVPHWLQPMNMCWDHKQVISEDQFHIWCNTPEFDFPDSDKKFRLLDVRYCASQHFPELRKAFPQLTVSQVARFIPAASHEVKFILMVEQRKATDGTGHDD